MPEYSKSNFSEKFPTFETFEEVVTGAIDYPEREYSWTTGGQTGGSCWDEGPSNYYSIDSEEEPELETLDEILELVAPDLSFLEYRKLARKDAVVKVEDNSYGDYYGNYTNGKKKKVSLEGLYYALMEIVA